MSSHLVSHKRSSRVSGRGRVHVASLAGVALASAVGATASAQTRFAIIGDYGVDNANQQLVANRVLAQTPNFIATTGDNNYFVGANAAADFANWDKTQGKYYAPYIKLPAGSAYTAQGATVNKFFPSIGNHDLDEGYTSWSNYFSSLPTNPSGNNYYYSYREGPVEIFVLTADPRADAEPTVGRSPSSTQYKWAEAAIRASSAPWQVVTFHQPGYTYASNHGPETAMRWPLKAWGVDAVFTGHNHNMQAMTVADGVNDGLPYFVQGAGGQSLYSISGGPSAAIGNFSNASNFGYTLNTVTDTAFKVDFYRADTNAVIHTQNLTQITPGPNPPTPTDSPASLTLVGYTQNFNSLSTTATAAPTGWKHFTTSFGSNSTWTNAIGIPASGTNSVASVAVSTAGTALTATTTPTGNNNGGFNAAAAPTATSDRVLATAPTTTAGAIVQLALNNDTARSMIGVSLSYDIRRYSAASSANELPGYRLFYSLDGTTWTNVSSLNPTLATTGTIQVPNTVGVTSVPLTTISFNGINITAGSTIFFRWVDDNATQTSPDQILGLDNIVINPVVRDVRLVPATSGTPAFTVTGGYNVSTFDTGNQTQGAVNFAFSPAVTPESMVLVALDLVGSNADIDVLVEELERAGFGASVDPVFGSGFDAQLTVPVNAVTGLYTLNWNYLGSGVTLGRIAVVPEPTGLGLLAPAAAALLRRRRR